MWMKKVEKRKLSMPKYHVTRPIWSKWGIFFTLLPLTELKVSTLIFIWKRKNYLLTTSHCKLMNMCIVELNHFPMGVKEFVTNRVPTNFTKTWQQTSQKLDSTFESSISSNLQSLNWIWSLTIWGLNYSLARQSLDIGLPRNSSTRVSSLLKALRNFWTVP